MRRAVIAAALAACALTLSQGSARADDSPATTSQASEGDAASFKAEFRAMRASYIRCYDAGKWQSADTFNQSDAVERCEEAQRKIIAVRLLSKKFATQSAVAALVDEIQEYERKARGALKMLEPTSAPPRDAVAGSGMPLAGGGGSRVTVGLAPSDRDRDRDGILDEDDACPLEPGETDPDPHKNGCPKFIRRITGSSGMQILKTIEFATGNSTIFSRSFPILDEVVRLVKVNADINLDIEGHTDNKGSDDLNEKLANERAHSVMKYMVEKGIAADRLSAAGYGPKRPIGDNDTADGRQRNRRVEFRLSMANKAKMPPKAGVLGDDLAPGQDPLKK